MKLITRSLSLFWAPVCDLWFKVSKLRHLSWVSGPEPPKAGTPGRGTLCPAPHLVLLVA